MIILQLNALLETVDLTDSVQRKGHFSLYNGLGLGHFKFKGVQRVYCNPFPAKPFDGSHPRPPGLNHGAFVVSPGSVGCTDFAPFLSNITNRHRGPKRLTVHSCQRWKHMTILKMVIIVINVNIEIIYIGVVLL